ncbi:SOS-induced cell division inhibitor SulA [Musicola paradisiaca]|uniref:Cell division inhibitor SulA n=1 Tax=Musicola paradisiaca (strain Ech703) TaxID=579405 RepID=C6CAH6_MUSP7|nr:SOS-induced cell division inhibitor SulA [Musicola paradisiaca]ACS86474.1 cell division inhibitor SulA [Musicola paradisiaca Ech703]
MRQQTIHSRPFFQAPHQGQQIPSVSPSCGVISEIVYGGEQPVFAPLLLPLLQQLGMQSRWLLWLSPQQKLSRPWLQQSGLPLNKMIAFHHLDPAYIVDAMEKALITGNYSVVLCWLNTEVSDEQKMRLRHAAQHGNTYGFIIRSEEKSIERPFSTLKIHSRLYH